MTSKQEQALAALMTHRTRREAAEAAGISERTLRGYFQDKDFRAKYRARCFEIMEDAAMQSKQLLQRALAVFEEVMDDPDEKNAVRVQAADRAAEYSLRLEEQAVMIQEILELREAIHPDAD